MRNNRAQGDAGGLLIVANWRSDVGYAWWFMERIWIALAEVHTRGGGTVHIIYPKVRSVPPAITAAGIKVHELDFSDDTRANRRRLKDLIQSEKISSVYLTDRKVLDRTYARLRRWGVKRLVNNDQTPGDRSVSTLKRLAKTLLQRTGIFSCDLYIAPSSFVMHRFIDVYGLPADKCLLIPNGIEPIDVIEADREYTKREFGLPKSAIVVVSLSRAVHYKGISFIIDCANRLINDEGRDDLYFIHCGDGPDLGEFRARVVALGLEERFLLPGARPDYRKILPASDVAMHASHGEGFSLAVLECMSAGLGMLVPDNSGNREAVQHGISGYCFTPGDLEHAAAHLRELVSDAGARHRLGQAARHAVLERFTLTTTLRRFQETAGRVLSRGSVLRS